MLVTEIDILVLLAVACLTAIALKRLQFPYTVALVLLGIALGWLGQHVVDLEFLQTLTLSHDPILFVFALWGITAYVTQVVPTQLRSLFQDSGLDDGLLEPCIRQYDQWRQIALQQLAQLSSESDSLATDAQTQVAQQIAQNSQNTAIADLIAMGGLNKTAGDLLRQGIDSN
ncbi:MAG: hypothetical protein QNJ46_28505 [Leptolyngbyaceae cyanobacterium MO_188.B28]|nr:hypothetical protein [Leptolyngbyaceae cyanobacterium MO_188.B28]